MEAPPGGAGRQPTRALFIQVLVGLVANLAAVAPGMNLGYSAVALPAMKISDNITEEEASWIASLASIATPIGCLVSGPLLDRWGRKVALFAVNVPATAGWLLLATSPDLTQVYAGRLLTGLSTGMASVPATVYVAETSHQSIRGMLVTWPSIFMALGILLVYLLGYCFPTQWRLVAGLSATFPILSALFSCFLPESPVWLANRGMHEKAQKNLRFLRGTAARHDIDAFVVQTAPKSIPLRAILEPQIWKPLLIMNLFFFFQQFAGVFVVVFYAIDIAAEAGVEANGYLVTVLIGLTRLVVTVGISYASKHYGRRPLAVISGAGMTLCMGVLAGYLLLRHLGEVGEFPLLPAVCLVLFIFTSTVGFLTLPWAMIGEVFPSRVRGLAGGSTTCLAYLFSFAIVKTYPQMKHAMQSHGVFGFYGAMSLLGTLFVYFFLPETYGKTLEEVEEGFARRRPQEDISMAIKP
ncbi:hypothetical protein L9F63_015881 [Diploptera punctata]|uniref:Major facilitator superfamily (MFS) profile domain-containing protein n=1 Tax=Diploptera punctata TaxID=6984 RepID=A0AAD8EJ33_DIPPU|nr:hypothetical protein L9F63_015881 [Diploptera punctata]